MDIGQRIYYTGDMANQDGHFVVAAIRAPGCVDLQELPGDLSHGRDIKGIYERHIGHEYHGHCNPRFVTEEARQAYYAQISASTMAYKAKLAAKEQS